MHIEIDYDGSVAKCLVSGYSFEGPISMYTKQPFIQCDAMTQIMVIDAFRTIKQHWEREQKKGGKE